MAEPDYTEQLNSVIESVLEEHGLDTFEEYWNLAQEVLEDMPIRRFYVHAESGYGNVAVLTDSLLIDIDGDKDEEDSSGIFTITPIKTIGEVRFHEGSVPTIPASSDAELLLFVSVFGDTDIGRYWIADTEQERDYLVLFGKALIEAINSI